jgi:superfamily II DNA helicase RecQ
VCRGTGVEALVAADTRVAGTTRASAPRPGAIVDPEAAARFDRLRALRKRLADGEGVPAYIVFSDATLRAMAERVPRGRADLAMVPGVGPVKLERYGGAFLQALAEG